MWQRPEMLEGATWQELWPKVEEQRYRDSVAHQRGSYRNTCLIFIVLLLPPSGWTPSEPGGQGSSSVLDKNTEVNRVCINSVMWHSLGHGWYEANRGHKCFFRKSIMCGKVGLTVLVEMEATFLPARHSHSNKFNQRNPPAVCTICCYGILLSPLPLQVSL